MSRHSRGAPTDAACCAVSRPRHDALAHGDVRDPKALARGRQPRESTTVDPHTHARHTLRQDDRSTFYQYTYDSRDDPRCQRMSSAGTATSAPFFRVERFGYSRVEPPMVSRGDALTRGGGAVVVEEATEDIADSVTEPWEQDVGRSRPHARRRARTEGTTAMPIVEEPDDEEAEAESVGARHRTLDQRKGTHGQPRHRAPVAYPREANGVFGSARDPFLEMERMHWAMRQNLMAPMFTGRLFGGLGHPFELDDDDDLFFPVGFAAPERLVGRTFGRMGMGMGFN